METKHVKSFDEFRSKLVSSPDLQIQFKEDPLEAVKQFEQQSPLQTDKWIYRIIVSSLGLTVMAIIIGVLVLMGTGRITNDQGVPTLLTAIGSAAIGALAGLLAPTPK